MAEPIDRALGYETADLHAATILDREEIRSVLGRVRDARRPLLGGLNRAVEREVAIIDELRADRILLSARNFESLGSGLRLTATDGGRSYYFVTRALDKPRPGDGGNVSVWVAQPSALHLVERREGLRVGRSEAARVRLGSREEAAGRLINESPGGMRVAVEAHTPPDIGSDVEVAVGTGSSPFVGEVRDVATGEPAQAWLTLGLKRRPVSTGEVRTEYRKHILPRSPLADVRRAGQIAQQQVRSIVRAAVGRARDPELEQFSIETPTGQTIAALVDRTSHRGPGPLFVLPPAWGRTKETLVPLARTLVAMCDRAGEPATVVRFDGVGRRGESTNLFQAPGTEHHGFTISQAVRDILAVANWAQSEIRPTQSVIVSFSASSIEARKALRLDAKEFFSGWVAVVGPADLQAALRIVSGGVDYVGGWQKGVRFGLQEILGVEINVDLANADAEHYGLATLDDAKSDFEKLELPITWLHGEFDAWMDLPRVKEALAFGPLDQRKVFVLPTAHQLRASSEALDVFQLIGVEAGNMAGLRLEPTIPDIRDLKKRSRAERARLPKRAYSPRDFWRNYLLGTGSSLGMELMLRTQAYKHLVDQQVDALDIGVADSVLDLGSGAASLGPLLAARQLDCQLCSADLVGDALRVARSNHFSLEPENVGSFVQFDATDGTLPFREASFDAVLASLLLSYIEDPACLLRECFRVLKPGGRLVVSSLKPDADVSRIWVEEAPRLISEAAKVGPAEEARIRTSLPAFFNSAAKVLDLEESGRFQFWGPGDLCDLVTRAGFKAVRGSMALGSPQQATLAQGVRP